MPADIRFLCLDRLRGDQLLILREVFVVDYRFVDFGNSSATTQSPQGDNRWSRKLLMRRIPTPAAYDNH